LAHKTGRPGSSLAPAMRDDFDYTHLDRMVAGFPRAAVFNLRDA
jgi:hypothetical protein